MTRSPQPPTTTNTPYDPHHPSPRISAHPLRDHHPHPPATLNTCTTPQPQPPPTVTNHNQHPHKTPTPHPQSNTPSDADRLKGDSVATPAQSRCGPSQRESRSSNPPRSPTATSTLTRVLNAQLGIRYRPSCWRGAVVDSRLLPGPVPGEPDRQDGVGPSSTSAGFRGHRAPRGQANFQDDRRAGQGPKAPIFEIADHVLSVIQDDDDGVIGIEAIR